MNIDTDSYLITTLHKLRSKPVGDFTTEDLRIAIGQGFGLPFLVPLAIEKLEEDIFAEGDFYEGDLLRNVLAIDASFWKQNRALWRVMRNLFLENKYRLEAHHTTKRIKEGWFNEFSLLENHLN